MRTEIGNHIKTSILVLLIFSVLTGLIYPAVVTLLAQLFVPYQANGSLIHSQGKLIGSHFIGQYFEDPRYFWGRPSATPSFPYNAAHSSGSNWGTANPEFLAQVTKRIALLKKYDLNHTLPLVPVDLVTASASGLDPEISPLAALYQIPRIAQARAMSEQDLEMLVKRFLKKGTLHLLGEPRVNVFDLNLALDNIRTDS